MVAIYTRISKDRENQISTEIQKENGIKLANRLKLPYKLFEEAKGTSGGKSISQRPKLNELVNGIYDGTITAVYFYNQDRSSRDEVTWFTLANTIIEYDIKLYENGNLVNLNDSDTYMLSGFKAMINADFRRKTSKKVKDAHLKLLNEGKATGAVTQYGYRKGDDGFIIIDKEEEKIVLRIFKESLNGIGSRRISIALNNENIKTSYAKIGKGTFKSTNNITNISTIKNKEDIKWSPNTVMQILKSSWYYGKRTVKEKTYDVPPILSYDYWVKVNDNITANRKNTGANTNRFLLRGILKCKCGHNMYGRVVPSKNENFYKCASKRKTGKHCNQSNSINRPLLDELIWNRFFESDILKNLVIKHFKEANNTEIIKKLKQEQIQHNKKIESLNKQKENTITFASKNIITPEELDKQLKRIRVEKNKIDINISHNEQQLKIYNNSIKSSEEITNELNQNPTLSSYNDIKTLIHKYIANIEVSFKHNHFIIKIDFNINNIKPQYIIIHKRFYYAIEPVGNTYFITPNKPNQIRKGKSINLSTSEFLNLKFKQKEFEEVTEITVGILLSMPHKTFDKRMIREYLKQNLNNNNNNNNKSNLSRVLKK